jgi:pimeloyl-ACP methyl ester carboxylesterase
MIDLSPNVDHHIIYLDGRKVHYSARGPEDAPLVLVGVNGLAGGGDSFWPLLGGVPDTVRVLLPDIPGCGESAPLDEAHTIDAYTAWLHRFITHLAPNARAVLISVATGAPITVRYAAQYPEQTAGLIFSLPFLGRIALPKWVRPIAAYALQVPALRELIDVIRHNDDWMHQIITHEPPEAIPELAERDIDHKQQASLRAVGELLHDLMLMDSRAEMPRLRTPMLFMAAEHDAFSPLPVLQGIVRGRPERHLFVKVGQGHSWNEEFIAEMQERIRAFLYSRDVAPPEPGE